MMTLKDQRVKLLIKSLRIIGLVLMISLASFGIGIIGAVLPEQKLPMKKEDTIEMVENQYEEEAMK